MGTSRNTVMRCAEGSNDEEMTGQQQEGSKQTNKAPLYMYMPEELCHG